MPTFIRTIIRFVVIAGLVYLAMVGWLLFQLRTINDVDSYADIVQTWEQPLVAHFPNPASLELKKTRFSYFPGFLQGGAHIQLRRALQPEQILEKERKLSQQAILIMRANERDKDQARLNDDEPPPLPAFHVKGDEAVHEFPDNFTLYYLVAQPGTTTGFLWNHGRTAGVAVSMEPPEIVYWAERW
jgi:hypothetical protein